jgi:hypothetical protein
MNTAKKIVNISFKANTWILVAFAVFMMIFTVFTVATVDKNERSIFGFKFYIVKTDSMSLSENNADLDVHFNAGDIVIIKNLDEKAKTQLEQGMIISFLSTNSDSRGEVITHMIRSVIRDSHGNVIGYETFGTNTGDSDEAVVEPSYVLGAYSNKLPGVGNFFAFVKSTRGYIICILIPFLLLILYNGINVIRLFRQYKREQMEAMQAERDQIDAERAETQRMMQELLALKAQLERKDGEGVPPTAPPASEAKPTVDTPIEPTAVSETNGSESGDTEPTDTSDQT